MDRRNTVASIGSGVSDPSLSRLDEGNESDSSAANAQRQTRNSLRNRFKMLRMREEAGIQSFEGQEVGSPTRGSVFAGLVGRSASVGLGIGSPTSVADDKEGGPARSPVQTPVSPGASASSIVSPVNPALAPGTASGVSAGPSTMADSSAAVDWDLWQSVVYEGPAAVAKTSAEELNRAIASGIPSAIRGVVWQVLAQSKNEELEGVYRELVARGTDKDRDLKDQPTNASSNLANGHLKEKAPATSSASSVHSEHSTPTTNGMVSPTSQNDKDSEGIAKLQAAMRAERKKKTKEDAAALQKLEKTIKRDLGTRTSFSKYTAAAGLQDGLFGVCKAYALFDEGVGYAQGMNFLAMPLLFNVSREPWYPYRSSDTAVDARRRSVLPFSPINEPVSSARHVYPRHARSAPTPLSIRATTGGHRTSTILPPQPARCSSATLCNAMVSYAFCVPLSSPACSSGS